MCVFLNVMIWFIETMEKSGKRKRCLYGRASCQAAGRPVVFLAPGVEETVPVSLCSCTFSTTCQPS